MSLNKNQCFLENAIGTIKKAAVTYGEHDEQRCISLLRLAQEAAALREPDAAAHLDRKRLKRIQAAGAAA